MVLGQIGTGIPTLGSDPAWDPKTAKLLSLDGSPVHMACSGRWETFAGDLDPSSIGVNPRLRPAATSSY